MAIKALNQISIIDLTDGYSVDLAQNSGIFQATKDTKTAINADTTFNFSVSGLQGSEVIRDLKIGTCIVRDANGNQITYTGTSAATAPITVTTTNASQSGQSFTPASVTIHVYGTGSTHTAYAGEKATVEIPVYVEGTPGDPDTDSDIIITKIFSISASLVGQDGMNTFIRYSAVYPLTSATDMKENPSTDTIYIGIASVATDIAPAYNSTAWKWSKYVGDNGTPGIDYYISSSNGQFFRNTGINTTLTIHGRDSNLNEMTQAELRALGTIKWYMSYDPTAQEGSQYNNEVPNSTNQISISVTDALVSNEATFYVVIETND